MGVALGDYDGDGWDDLYVTQFPRDILLRNDKGTLMDVTAEVGLRFEDKRWGAGASFLDYDKDGDLNLFVSNYIDFDPTKTPKPGANPNCTWKAWPSRADLAVCLRAATGSTKTTAASSWM